MLYQWLEILLESWGIAPIYPDESLSFGSILIIMLTYATLVPSIVLCFAICWDMLRTSRRFAVAVAAVSTLLYLLWNVFLRFSPLPGSFGSVTSLIFVVIVLLGFWRISTLDMFRALFTALSCACVMAVCVFAGQIVDTMAMGEWRWMASMNWTYIVPTYVLAAIAVAALWKPARTVMPRILASPVITPVAWRVLWLAPFGLYALLMMYQDLYMDVLNDHSAQVGVVAVIMYCALLMLLYWLLWKADGESARRAEVEQKNRQLTVSRMQVQALTERVGQARRTRHDLRHHLVTIRGYVQRHDESGLSRYLDGLIADADLESSLTVCENVVANSLVAYYLSVARRTGITTDARLDIPAELSVNDTDLAVVLGNVLENAVTAASQYAALSGGTNGDSSSTSEGPQPFLTIRARTGADGTLFLTVDNSYAGPVRRNAQGKWLSSKHPGTGVGLQSVRTVIDRLGGELRITPGDHSSDSDQSVDARTFSVSLMIPA